MLEGCAEDEQRSARAYQSGIDFAEDACKRRGDLGVGAVVQLSELRVDEGGDWRTRCLPWLPLTAAVAMS